MVKHMIKNKYADTGHQYGKTKKENQLFGCVGLPKVLPGFLNICDLEQIN